MTRHLEWFYNSVFPYLWLGGAIIACVGLVVVLIVYLRRVRKVGWKWILIPGVGLFILLGWLNFFALRVVAVQVGGYALRGEIKEDVHFVRNGAGPVQVSSMVYWRMYYYEHITHTWMLASIVLLFATGAYIERVRRRVSRSQQEPSAFSSEQ
jgi:hypothetical protein